MSRKDLVPVVPYSWFPFPGTRGDHTWGSRATERSWSHVAEGEALEFAMQVVYSFCPLEGALERPRSLMGLRQLPRRGQLRVDDAHHFRSRFEGGREQGPQPFAAEALAFWAWQPYQRCHHASRSCSTPPVWERAVLNRACRHLFHRRR
jgi:hypothetical protein